MFVKSGVMDNALASGSKGYGFVSNYEEEFFML